MAFRRALGDLRRHDAGGRRHHRRRHLHQPLPRRPAAPLGGPRSWRPGSSAARSRWPGRSPSPSSPRSSRRPAASTSTCGRPTTRWSRFLFGWASLRDDPGRRHRRRGDHVRPVRAAPGRSARRRTPAPLAVLSLAVLALVNYAGVKPGSRLLNVLVLLKIGALAVLILGGLWMAPSLSPPPPPAPPARIRPASLLAFGAALVPILFSYGGWQSANSVAEEMREPRRTLPRALVLGTAIVVVVYVLVNLVYLMTLTRDGLAATATPAADAVARIFGRRRRPLDLGRDRVSTFGFLNLSLLGADAHLLRDGAGRRLLSRASAGSTRGSARPTARSCCRPLERRPGDDRNVRRARGLGRLRRLDLLRARRGRRHPPAPPHPAGSARAGSVSDSRLSRSFRSSSSPPPPSCSPAWFARIRCGPGWESLSSRPASPSTSGRRRRDAPPEAAP